MTNPKYMMTICSLKIQSPPCYDNVLPASASALAHCIAKEQEDTIGGTTSPLLYGYGPNYD